MVRMGALLTGATALFLMSAGRWDAAWPFLAAAAGYLAFLLALLRGWRLPWLDVFLLAAIATGAVLGPMLSSAATPTALSFGAMVPATALLLRGPRAGLLWVGGVVLVAALGVLLRTNMADAPALLPLTRDEWLWSMSLGVGLGCAVVGLTRLSSEEDLARLRAALAQGEGVRKELEAARSRARRDSALRDAFLARVHHDVRTPLHGLLGAVDLIDARRRDEDDAVLLDTIKTCAITFREVARGALGVDLTDDARGQAVAADLRGLIRGVHNASLAAARAHDVELRSEVDREVPPHLLVDEVRLRHALTNLLGNAIERGAGGAVGVQCRYDAARSKVEIDVEDNGAGLDGDTIASLFGSFSDASLRAWRATEGHGLGLVIARACVESLGGTLRVVDAEAGGSRLRLCFSAAATMSPVSHRGSGSEEPLRILVVDDHSVNRMVLREIVARLGHRVSCASGGREAIAMHAHHRFDCVLMDCEMPGMTGFEAAERIRTFDPDVPIIAVTAHAVASSRVRAHAAGMTSWVSKPVGRDALRDLLRSRHADRVDA